MDTKNVIAAISLSAAVIILYSLFFVEPPDPNTIKDQNKRKSIERSLSYMGLEANQPINTIKIDRVFIGSCTNGRIEDLREVANLVKGKKVSNTVDAMIVPGSGLVKEQAEK